jgi:hypothetical protein
MPGLILAMSLVFAYGAYMYFFWRSGRKNHTSTELEEKKPAIGSEDESEIVRGRLAHFASQIGHWRISSMVKKHIK